jgi:hypothetical protein
MISGITDNVQGRTASYTYDDLNRLALATTSGSTAYPSWGLSWTYNRCGNNYQQSISSGCTAMSCPTWSFTPVSTTNQISTSGTTYSYDSGGNLTNDGFNALTYDAENRVVSVTNSSSGGAYVYDGNGRRFL